MAISDQIVGAESGGDPNATNPNSSAMGAGQFITSTWNGLIKQHRPDLAANKSDEEIAAMRSDPVLSRQMVDAYAADNNDILTKNGLPVTPGNTYLAHFAGPQGAVSVLQADPTASAGSILGDAVIKANPFLKNMTVGDLRAWADKKMGGQTGAPASPASPAAGPPQNITPNLATTTTPPVFAQPQQAQGSTPTTPAPVSPFTASPPAAMYAPQNLSPLPRRIDFSQLRAALGNQVFFMPKGLS